MSRSGWKVHFTEEGLEAGVGAEGVRRPIHLPHAAFANLDGDLVGTESGADLEDHDYQLEIQAILWPISDTGFSA